MHQLHLPTNVVCFDYIIAAVKICTSLAEHPIVQDINNRIDVGELLRMGISLIVSIISIGRRSGCKVLQSKALHNPLQEYASVPVPGREAKEEVSRIMSRNI